MPLRLKVCFFFFFFFFKISCIVVEVAASSCRCNGKGCVKAGNFSVHTQRNQGETGAQSRTPCMLEAHEGFFKCLILINQSINQSLLIQHLSGIKCNSRCFEQQLKMYSLLKQRPRRVHCLKLISYSWGKQTKFFVNHLKFLQ